MTRKELDGSRTAKRRPNRRVLCDWCLNELDFARQQADHWNRLYEKVGRAEPDPVPRHKRRDSRFCTSSCRQSHWQAVTYYSWTIDGVTKTGKEWEAEGYEVRKGEWGKGPQLYPP